MVNPGRLCFQAITTAKMLDLSVNDWERMIDRLKIKPRKLLYLPQLAGLCLTQLPIVLAVKARQTDLFIEEESIMEFSEVLGRTHAGDHTTKL